ncbi:hypothetical protein PoB_002343600 [Plakobranchus ocellatus]|uniref:Uncharacterized protein n=1 Tax=Plakobranchus ocellatus TaxID=259542 RepID=A0AAV3ZLT9_9GAST|nr:hypothetical protein PoB_002343600 [Plakobranchus ocellatus]
MKYEKFCPKVSNEIEARTRPKCVLHFPSVASMKRLLKCVHQKAGAMNEDEGMLHVSDEHLSCSEDEDGEEWDDAFSCKDNLRAALMDSDPYKMPVFRNIFDAMQCPWTDE